MGNKFNLKLNLIKHNKYLNATKNLDHYCIP